MLVLTAMSILAMGTLQLTSPAFENHQAIPKKYTCQGDNISPPLAISKVPSGTKSLCLIVEDPDTSHGTIDHWVAWNISPTATMSEGKKVGVEGINSLGTNGYHGPCPPTGHLHHYHFKLYALDSILNLEEGSSKDQVIKAIHGHILGQTELIGTYYRS